MTSLCLVWTRHLGCLALSLGHAFSTGRLDESAFARHHEWKPRRLDISPTDLGHVTVFVKVDGFTSSWTRSCVRAHVACGKSTFMSISYVFIHAAAFCLIPWTLTLHASSELILWNFTDADRKKCLAYDICRMVAGGSSFALSKSIFEKASTYLEFASIRVLYDLVTIIFVVGIYFATFVFTPGDLKQSAKCVASCGSPNTPPAVRHAKYYQLISS